MKKAKDKTSPKNLAKEARRRARGAKYEDAERAARASLMQLATMKARGGGEVTYDDFEHADDAGVPRG